MTRWFNCAGVVNTSKSGRLGPVAQQILAYLNRHRHAQDTLEGIAEWWLVEQRVRHVVGDVKKAVGELVAQGLVLERTARDGRVSYRLDQRKHKLLNCSLANQGPLTRAQRDT